MTTLEVILLSALCLCVGYVIGITIALMTATKDVPEKPKKKAHIPRYNAGNLLEPISPADQRLEKMLETKPKKHYFSKGGNH